MALVVKDRVRETSVTQGTGTFTLAGAVTGYQSFSAIGNGNTTYYTIYLQASNEWEVGIGTYTASGTTLSRDTILASSNGGSVVNFSAGTKDVFVTYPAGRSVYYDTATNVTVNQLSATTVDVSNLEVATIKAQDGTSSATIANSTGVISISANPILSGGTANGVLYLNATKVATSGTALTFDGSTFKVSAANLAYIGLINGTTRGVRFGADTVGASIEGVDNTGIASYQPLFIGGADVRFTISGTERARITTTGGFETRPAANGHAVFNEDGVDADFRVESDTDTHCLFVDASTNNVGIGTNAPAAKLEVSGGGATTVFKAYSSSASIGGIITSFNNTSENYYDANTHTFRFGNGGGPSVIINSSGNVGLNVTAVPYGASNKVLQIDGGANASELRLTNNTTGTSASNGGLLQMSGNDLYIWNVENSFVSFGTNNTEKARITATGGFETRPEANGNAVFNENSVDADFRVESDANTHRLFVDAGADTVLMGTTTNTNSSKLVVDGSISETVSSTQYLVASQYDIGTAANEIPLNQYLGNLAYQDASSIAGQVGLSAGTAALPSLVSATDLDTGMWFPAANTLAWSTGGTERVRINSAGNVGIGTNAPQGPLEVQVAGATANQFLTGGVGNNAVTGIFRIGSGSGRGASIQGFRGLSSNVHSLDFYSYNSADVFGMRLDSSGNLGLGAAPGSPAYGYTRILDVAGQFPGVKFTPSGASTFGFQIGAGTNGFQFYDVAASAERMRIDSSGNLGIGTNAPNLLTWNKAATLNASSGNVAYELGLNNVAQAYFGADATNVYLAAYANKPLLVRTNNATVATFDTSGNLGLGVTPSAWTSGYSVLQTAGVGSFVGASQSLIGTNLYIAAGIQPKFIANGYAPAYNTIASTGQHVWYTTGNNVSGANQNASLNQAMTLDASGNLLVGSTSTSGLITGQLQLGTTSSSNAGIQFLNSTTGSGGLYFGDSTSGNARFRGYIEYSHNSDAMLFGTAEAERMRLDASGNLGLGVTPSAWTTNFNIKAFDISNGCVYGATNDVNLAYNAFFNGTNFIYKTSTFAARYAQLNSGQHQWFTAASGTAGNAITFTQAMTLDASGNLLVGTTTTTNNLRANERLAIVAAGNNTYTGAAFTGYSGTTSAAAPVLDFNRSRGTTDGSMTVVASGDRLGLIFARGSDGTNFVDAASIDFWVDGTPGSNDMPGRIVFSTTADGASSTTERARITSGGYFKASNDGTYYGSTGSQHELRNTANGEWVVRAVSASATDPNGMEIRYSAATPNGTANRFLYCLDSTALRAEIRSNGGIANYSANNVALSDQRVKKDIVAAPSYWDKIKGIEIVLFKYKDQTHDDNNVGVIAQQVEQVAPEFVDQDGWDETPEDGVPLKSIYTSDMYHAAIKALQEAMARIEQLEAKVAVLEGK